MHSPLLTLLLAGSVSCSLIPSAARTPPLLPRLPTRPACCRRECSAAPACLPPPIAIRRCGDLQMLDSETAQPAGDETRAALQQTAITVAAACAFCAGVFATRGAEDASAWFAAYVLEKYRS